MGLLDALKENTTALGNIVKDMPDEEYFANSSISSTDIKRFISDPFNFYQHKFGKFEDEVPPSMVFGTHVHCRLLEPQRYQEEYVVFDFDGNNISKQMEGFTLDIIKGLTVEDAYSNNYSTKSIKNPETLSKKAQEMLNKLQDYINAKSLEIKQGKKLISTSTETDLEKIKVNFDNHPIVQLLKEKVENGADELVEVAGFWTSSNGLELKFKPDWVIIDHEVETVYLCDLKTTRDAGAKSFSKSFFYWSYDIQAAFYRKGLTESGLIPADIVANYKFVNYIIACQNVPPHGCNVFKIDEEVISEGTDKVNNALSRLNIYLEKYGTADPHKWLHNNEEVNSVVPIPIKLWKQS